MNMTTVCGVSDIKTATDDALELLLSQLGRNGDTPESDRRREEISAELAERERARAVVVQTT